MKPKTKFPPIITAGLAKQIAASIRETILGGTMKVDQRLPTEDELAIQFGVSRPTIREALKRLAAENLIQSRRGPQGGSLIKRPSPDEVSSSLSNVLRLLTGLGEFGPEDIFEARCEFEATCCRIIAKHRKTRHLSKMRAELVEQRRPSLTDEEFCASDVRFHRALVEATENPIFQYLLYAISDALQPITNLVVFRFRDRKIIYKQHQQLIDALEALDADGAEVVLQQQTRYLIESYGKAADWKRQQAKESSRLRSRG